MTPLPPQAARDRARAAARAAAQARVQMCLSLIHIEMCIRDRDDPILRPSLNSVRMTYDLAQMPEYEDLMTAVSPYTGRRVNRFTHIHQSAGDLVKNCLLYTSRWV